MLGAFIASRPRLPKPIIEDPRIARTIGPPTRRSPTCSTGKNVTVGNGWPVRYWRSGSRATARAAATHTTRPRDDEQHPEISVHLGRKRRGRRSADCLKKTATGSASRTGSHSSSSAPRWDEEVSISATRTTPAAVDPNREVLPACVESAHFVIADGPSRRRRRARRIPTSSAAAATPRGARSEPARHTVGMGPRSEDGGLRSRDVSRLDMIVRWGGGRRLSGFLPVQSVYADIYVVDAYWPDFEPAHMEHALEWYSRQDRTLGG